jgi:hypothetical protein
MSKTRRFIEDKLLIEIENRRNMEENYLQEYPLHDAQIAEYHYIKGFIAGLQWILQSDMGVGLQDYTSEIKIKDVLANLIPHIASHKSQCDCHQCITNDVLQYFIRERNKQ